MPVCRIEEGLLGQTNCKIIATDIKGVRLGHKEVERAETLRRTGDQGRTELGYIQPTKEHLIISR